MDTNMNQPQGTPMNQPMAPMPKKKGHGALIGIVVLILLIVAAIVFWPKDTASNNAIPPTTAGTPGSSVSSNTQAQSDDLNSLEADVESTNVDGVSNGL